MSEQSWSSPPPRGELTSQEAEAILRQLALASFPLGAEGGPPAGNDSAWAEQQLHKAEARFRTLVEQIPAVTFMAALDEGVNELYVSPQIEALLGFSQKEWLEDPVLWYTRLHPDDRERWHEEFARTCAAGEHFRSEYRFLARNGRVVWVHGEAQIVRDAHGRPLFLQGLAYDITESKRAEQVLRRLHEELETQVQDRTAELARVNRALQEEIVERKRLEEALRQRADQLAAEGRRKDHFLAVLGHELRNPLAPLSNALQLFRLDGAADESRRLWVVGLMERQVLHMTRLIDDLLDVARINQGKIELRRQPVDLTALVPRAAESTRPFLNERRHRLTVSLPEGPAFLDADPIRLEQVLVNLLNNAAKYTEPGGHIELTATVEPDGAVVRVRDTGVGIPPEMLERVFDLFTQVDQSLSKTSQWGLGIGLTLVRHLVELHGGTVRAFSAGRGQGSEFVVRLPRLRETPTSDGVLERTPAVREPLPPVGRGPVLVVDDNTDVAETTAVLLRDWGHEVQVVSDGPAALEAARTRPPAVALVDIGLPGLDGYELARRLRRLPELKEVVLVALTGYGQDRDRDRDRARAAGFDLFLTKPVAPEALRRFLADPKAAWSLASPFSGGR